MTKLRDLKGFEECVPKIKCEHCEFPYTDCRCDTHNNTIDKISDVNVVMDEEAVAKIAYEQYMKNAKIEAKWEINLTEVGKEHWRLVSKAIASNINFIRLEKSDDTRDKPESAKFKMWETPPSPLPTPPNQITSDKPTLVPINEGDLLIDYGDVHSLGINKRTVCDIIPRDCKEIGQPAKKSPSTNEIMDILNEYSVEPREQKLKIAKAIKQLIDEKE